MNPIRLLTGDRSKKIRQLQAKALFYSLMAGAIIGLLDGLFALSQASRFLDGFISPMGLILFSMLLYSFALGLLQIPFCLVFLSWLFGSAPGRAAMEYWKSPHTWSRFAASGVALLPMAAAWIGAMTFLAVDFSGRFNHRALAALLLAVTGLGLIFVCALLASFLVTAIMALFRLVNPRGTGPLAALLIPLLLALGGLAALGVYFWETVRNLPLHPIVLTGAMLVLLPFAHLPPLAPRWFRLPVALALLLFQLFALHFLFTSDTIRKSAESGLGLGREIPGIIRAVVDFDRDGYSPLFGGGDCNDFDPWIHPGAFDWPDDGIDQNCLGGDAKVRDRVPFPYFEVPPEVPDNLNVLLITIDTLNARHLGCYGYHRDTSPRLDQFSKKSYLFERSFAHAPSTRYSFPALMTARYPSSVAWGQGSWPPPVLPENLTFAEVMQEEGLHTAAILNYRFFREEWGLNQGFDHYDNSRSVLHHGKSDPATHGISSHIMTDASIEYLESLGTKRNFLWVHYYDPHWYYERHPGYKSFGDERIDLYDGEIYFTDHHIGRLLDYMESSGRLENTMVIITGDHGEGFGEKGIHFHGYHLYNPQTFVPLIIYVPGMPGGRISSQVATHVDILPTVSNLMGLEPRLEFQGGSLLDLMKGKEGYHRRRFQEVWYADKGPFTRMISVLEKSWKLIFNEQPSGTYELYNLDDDFWEEKDLWSTADPAIKKELSSAIIRHMEEDHLPPDFHERIAPLVSNKPFDDCPDNVLVHLGNPPILEIHGVDFYRPDPSNPRHVRITVFWKVNKAVPRAWKLFTHLKPKRGRFINADHTPLYGFFPLEHWRPGTWIKNILNLDLEKDKASKSYTLSTGLYRGNSRMEARVLKGSAKALPGGGVDLATIPAPSTRTGKAKEGN